MSGLWNCQALKISLEESVIDEVTATAICDYLDLQMLIDSHDKFKLYRLLKVELGMRK